MRPSFRDILWIRSRQHAKCLKGRKADKNDIGGDVLGAVFLIYRNCERQFSHRVEMRSENNNSTKAGLYKLRMMVPDA